MANAERVVPGEVAGPVGAGSRPGGVGAARVALWFVAGGLAVWQVVLGPHAAPGERFGGTPFAGLALGAVARTIGQSLGVAGSLGALLLVAVLGLVVARALPEPVSRRTALLAVPGAISLLMLSLPVRSTLHLGQAGIVPVLAILLVLLGCFQARRALGERGSGVLIGVAAALQPGAVLFAPLLWLTGRKCAARAAGATFAVCSALAWAAMPRESWTYWVRHVGGADQSLHGALLRFGFEGPLGMVLFLVLGAAVVVLGLRRAVRYARDGQLLLAVAVTGCVAVAVWPAAGQQQLLWVLFAAVGRVGARAADRMVWPVAVVLVMTLPGTVLLPNLTPLLPVRDNVLLVTALAAACAVPFLKRTSPRWPRPAPARRRPLLTRPNLFLELLLIRVGYSAYSHVRAAATGGRATAEEHARQLLSVEGVLHIDIERWVNHAVAGTRQLEWFFDFYYVSFHFVVPLTILGVLYARRPADYRWARSSLGCATVLALAGFWLFPLAPPRLMPGLGYIDTVHGPQDLASPQYGVLTGVTNQYAAMPSLHFGWSLWCGLVVVVLAGRGCPVGLRGRRSGAGCVQLQGGGGRRRGASPTDDNAADVRAQPRDATETHRTPPKPWLKVLGLVHPLLTLCSIVATANHWVLDAVGGAVVVGAGFALTYALTGPRAPVLSGHRRSPVPRRPRGAWRGAGP